MNLRTCAPFYHLMRTNSRAGTRVLVDVYESATATALGWTFALSNVFLAVFPVRSLFFQMVAAASFPA